MNLSRYEAIIRTDLNGNTKLYVMENEVSATKLKDIKINLEPIKKRKSSPENLIFYERRQLEKLVF